MKITKFVAVAIASASLAACGGGEANNVDNMDANMMMTDNLATDLNMDMNATADMNAMNADMNATTDMNAMEMNADANATANTL